MNRKRIGALALWMMSMLGLGEELYAQTPPEGTPADHGSAHPPQEDSVHLAELVSSARGSNPEIRAAQRMADAAEARIPQAGGFADPMLTLGAMYVPVPELDFRQDGMTMLSVQVAQRLPAPGTRGAREAAAEEIHEAAGWDARETELSVLSRLKSAYYEVWFLDRAREVVRRNRELLVDFAEIAGARFAVGRTPQQDVLRAQTEVTRLDEQLSDLRARRTAVLAELNAILQRPATESIAPAYPRRIRSLALGAAARGAFTAAALEGGLGADFFSLAELQEQAIQERPMLRAHVHRIAAGREEVGLRERERFPDIDVMVGYGSRAGRQDMVSASVSVPLPVFAGRKQRQAVVEAEQRLAADEARHHAMIHEIQAEIATRYSELVRARERLLLLLDGVMPQAEATVQSAAAAYQAGTVGFTSLLDAQATLFRTEIDQARQLADFGSALAELERATGVNLELEQP